MTPTYTNSVGCQTTSSRRAQYLVGMSRTCELAHTCAAALLVRELSTGVRPGEPSAATAPLQQRASTLFAVERRSLEQLSILVTAHSVRVLLPSPTESNRQNRMLHHATSTNILVTRMVSFKPVAWFHTRTGVWHGQCATATLQGSTM